MGAAPSVNSPGPAAGGGKRSFEPIIEIDTNDLLSRTRVAPDGEERASPGIAPLGEAVDLGERWPVAARVVDAHDSSPLEDFRLRIYRAGEPVPVVTDGEGVFVSGEALPQGDYWIGSTDAGYSDPVSLEHRRPVEGASLPELTFPVGPTFFLDLLELPNGLQPGDLLAGLLQGTDLNAPYAGRTELYPLRGPKPTGVRPWIRFGGEDVETVGTAGPWTLLVGSRDGRWLGTAKAPVIRGVHPEPLTVRLGDTSCVSGTVRDQNGLPRAKVRLRLDRQSGARKEWPGVDATSQDDGSFLVGYLEPGEYVLSVRGQQDVEADPVPVSIGTIRGNVEVDLMVRELPKGVAVSGIVRSRTGSFHGNVYLSLGPAGNGYEAVRWEERGGEWIGEFTFGDVPVGTFQLSGMIAGSHCRMSVPADPFQSPISGLEVVIHDDVPAHDLDFHVTDGATGNELGKYSFTLRFDASARRRWSEGTEQSSPAARQVPDDLGFDWILEAKGYAPAYGTAADFVAASGSMRVASASLNPGWGARFQFFTWTEDGTYGGGIPGVELVLDGIPMGTSDVDGYVTVQLPARPERLTVDSEHWELDPGQNVDASTGNFDDASKLPLGIALRRRPPR